MLVATLLVNKTSVKCFHMALTVISANIEGLTAVKASMLSVMCKDKHCQCLCLQETHRSQTQARPRIPGMSLVAERSHNKM